MKPRSLIALALLLGGCRDHRIIQPTLALPHPGELAPAFTFALSDSGHLASTQLRGQPTVLFLWSTHCPTSRRALADFRVIQNSYAGRASIVLLSDDASSADLARMPQVLAGAGVTGPVALARGHLGDYFDRSRSAPERDTARVEFVLPAYLVIDATGRVVERSWGPDVSDVRSALDRLLASRPAV